jgi:anti-anti-sigma regulatory factor
MTLKIQRSVEWQSVVVFTLAGRIRAEQVSELQALVTPELTNCCVVLDLRHVMLVDRDAVRFLIRCESEGVVLRNCSAYIREWIKQEMNAMHRERLENAAGLAG